MASTTNINKMTVVHAKSNGFAITFPDTCKTPSPGGPIPIPYPNIAMSKDAAQVTTTVSVDGQGIMVKGSNFAVSTGDEAGSVGGILSGVFKSKAEYANYSFDVKAEGKAVARLKDPMFQNCSSFNASLPAELQPPLPEHDISDPAQEEACKEVAANCHVKKGDRNKTAMECGMNPEHAKRISQACKSNGKAVTFRATNKDCMDKIRKGALAKPLAIKDKTISKKSLSKAVQDPEILQKVKKYDLMGYVGVYDKNKKLIGVRTTQGANPPKGILPIDRIPPPPEPRTTFSGDYDVHDFFGKGGRKIASGSVEEQKFMRQMNHAIGRGAVGDMRHDLVRHGAQSTYRGWCSSFKPPKSPDPIRLVPDLSPKDPLLAFDANGEMYKLQTEKDLRDYYKCKGQEIPEEWNWDAKRWMHERRAGNLNTSGLDFKEFVKQRQQALRSLK